MGVGVSVEKPRNEAKQIVEKRIAELEKTRSTLQKQLGQVVEQMRLNRQQLDEVSVRLSGRSQAGDVRKAKSRA